MSHSHADLIEAEVSVKILGSFAVRRRAEFHHGASIVSGDSFCAVDQLSAEFCTSEFRRHVHFLDNSVVA